MTFLVYMCVKLTTRDLNYDSYLPYKQLYLWSDLHAKVCGGSIKGFEVLQTIAMIVMSFNNKKQ